MNPICPKCQAHTDGMTTEARIKGQPQDPPLVRHTAYCDRCHHLLTWTEQTRPDGTIAIGRQQILRGKQTVAKYLKSHPIETGTIAR